jgi:hypothetical protein
LTTWAKTNLGFGKEQNIPSPKFASQQEFLEVAADIKNRTSYDCDFSFVWTSFCIQNKILKRNEKSL